MVPTVLIFRMFGFAVCLKSIPSSAWKEFPSPIGGSRDVGEVAQSSSTVKSPEALPVLPVFGPWTAVPNIHHPDG